MPKPILLYHPDRVDGDIEPAFRAWFGETRVIWVQSKNDFLARLDGSSKYALAVITDPYYSVAGYRGLLDAVFEQAEKIRALLYYSPHYQRALTDLYLEQIKRKRLILVPWSDIDLRLLLETTGRLL